MTGFEDREDLMRELERLREEMLVQDVERGRFTKSGRKPYF